MEHTFRNTSAGALLALLGQVVSAATITVGSANLGFTDSGVQTLFIAGAGLKDSGATTVMLGSRALEVTFESDSVLLAKCPVNGCGNLAQRLTLSTFSSGPVIRLVSSASWTFDPLNPTVPTVSQDAVPIPRFVAGSYGPLTCGRNSTPTAGSCPAGYAAIGLAEISFGDATGCQSDNGGDVPLVQVKPLCMKQPVRPTE